MTLKFIRLLDADGTWEKFYDQWKKQCEIYDEDIDEFAIGTFSVVREFIKDKIHETGVFAVERNDECVAIYKANRALIPGYTTPVLRIRHLVVSPDFDFGDKPIDDYALALTSALIGAVRLSSEDPEFEANHLKFHLSSPADRQFFAALGKGLNQMGAYQTVHSTGSWLYITKK